MSASKFYDQVNGDYLNWSRNLNIHFGYFRWPNLVHLFSLEKMLEEMNRQIKERLSVDENGKASILDVGCGIGTTSMQLSKELNFANFYGINISQKQIDHGNIKIQEEKLQDRINLVQADFTKIPMGNASFDAAFAIESACYDVGFDKKGFIEEMARLVKKGGKLVVADGFRKPSGQLPEWIGKLHRKNLDYWSMDKLADLGLFVERMKESGFDQIEVKEISWNVAPSAFYLPLTAIKIYWGRLFSNKTLTVYQKNYLRAIWLTLFLGMFRHHFGYFIITGIRK